MKWSHKKGLRYGLFILIGAAVGWLYYRLFGCTGSCAITSSPVRSMVYMAVIGGLLGVVTEKKN